MSDHSAIVVIGAGQAGARAAAAMRKAGYKGPLIIVGAERHLPYERPMLSKDLLLDSGAPIPLVMEQASYTQSDIALRLECRATGLDPATRTVSFDDGTTLHYGKLLLATGSRLRMLSIPDVRPDGIRYLRTLDESRTLERELKLQPAVAVVGGGFIGLEVAASAAKLGCSVTVIEAADRLLPRLGSPEASEAVLRHHVAAGINIRLRAQVSAARGEELSLADGSIVPAQVIVAGIGVEPETSLAKMAGLKVDNGIVVDAFGRTSDMHIFAAGDATNQFHPLLGRHVRLESWQNANLQAEAVGRAMAGLFDARPEVPWVWSDQGDLNLQVAGSPADADRSIMRGRADDPAGLTICQLRGNALVGAITVNRGKDMVVLRRLIEKGHLALAPERIADPSVKLRAFMPS